MTNTQRRVMQAIARERAPGPQPLVVSNRTSHQIVIGDASFNPSPHGEIRIGDLENGRNVIEVDGLPFPLLERIERTEQQACAAALAILGDPADVVIVSIIVFEGLAQFSAVPRAARALAKTISPSSSKRDRIKNAQGRTISTRRAFCHALFMEQT